MNKDLEDTFTNVSRAMELLELNDIRSCGPEAAAMLKISRELVKRLESAVVAYAEESSLSSS